MMSETGTKEKIMDAAEHLFALKGYPSTSLREITKAADANLAAVNYHFGSKDKLLTAILERRLLPLNAVRVEKLDEVLKMAEREKRLPGVEETLRAFVIPTLELLEGGGGARDFSIIVGRGLLEPDGFLKQRFLEMIKPVFKMLYDVLCKALPEVPEGIVYTRLILAIGAVSHTLRTYPDLREAGHGPGGLSPGLSIEAVTQELMGFISRGMEGK